MAMKELPAFVLPYKVKGCKIKVENGNYYLYRVSSHREKGKKYPVAKSEYVGVITEKDGLIESHPPVKGSVSVYRYGLFYIAYAIARGLLSSASIYPHQRHELIFVLCLFRALGLKPEQLVYENSYLSLLFPGLEVESELAENEEKTFSRVSRQVMGRIRDALGDDWSEIHRLSSYVYAVHVNGKWLLSGVNSHLEQLMESHGLSFSLEEVQV